MLVDLFLAGRFSAGVCELVGEVGEVYEAGGGHFLSVVGGERERLIPFTGRIVREVDVAAGRIFPASSAAAAVVRSAPVSWVSLFLSQAASTARRRARRYASASNQSIV